MGGKLVMLVTCDITRFSIPTERCFSCAEGGRMGVWKFVLMFVDGGLGFAFRPQGWEGYDEKGEISTCIPPYRARISTCGTVRVLLH